VDRAGFCFANFLIAACIKAVADDAAAGVGGFPHDRHRVGGAPLQVRLDDHFGRCIDRQGHLGRPFRRQRNEIGPVLKLVGHPARLGTQAKQFDAPNAALVDVGLVGVAVAAKPDAKVARPEDIA
jgi:hypothetical protein